jgi:hypothetical protein
MRLINQAFKDEPRMLSPEVPVSLYQVDIVLDLKQRNLFNIAIEVSDPVTKDFRTEYPSPGERVRTKFLKKKGYLPVSIDTNSFNGYDTMSDDKKQSVLREYILDKAYSYLTNKK